MVDFLAKAGALFINLGQRLALQRQQTAADQLQVQADALSKRQAALVAQIAHLRSGS